MVLSQKTLSYNVATKKAYLIRASVSVWKRQMLQEVVQFLVFAISGYQKLASAERVSIDRSIIDP